MPRANHLDPSPVRSAASLHYQRTYSYALIPFQFPIPSPSFGLHVSIYRFAPRRCSPGVLLLAGARSTPLGIRRVTEAEATSATGRRRPAQRVEG
jgi:hypothetical protein